MPKFRKRPVVIEAMQYTGENAGEIVRWAQGDWTSANMWVRQIPRDGGEFQYNLVIVMKNGSKDARPGDWVIRGENGEIYPCKSDLFEATYEAAE